MVWDHRAFVRRRGEFDSRIRLHALVVFNGSTTAFQADGAGSIPAERFPAS